MQGNRRARIGIIAADDAQQEALHEAARQAGHKVPVSLFDDCLSATALAAAEVDAWLVAMPDDPEAVRALEAVLMSAAVKWLPQPASALACFGEEYILWQERLGRDLAGLLAAPTPDPVTIPKRQARPPQSPRQVLVLASSLGGPPAVKSFLDALPAGLPVWFVYAQHIEPAQQESLVRVLARHSHYGMELARAGRHLGTGVVTMLPVESRFDVSATGLLEDCGVPWSGPYNPCLDEVIGAIARVFGARAGAVVFSGMGEDGSAGCQALEAAGGQVWAQEAAGCGCSSMPDAARAACRRVRSATPAALAADVARHYAGSGLPGAAG